MGGNREPERDIVGGGFVARIIILWFTAGNIDSVEVALRQYCLHPKIDVFLAMHQDKCLSRYIAKTIYFFGRREYITSNSPKNSNATA